MDCYSNNTTIRTLPAKYIPSQGTTAENCAQTCAGYTYFGVEYSQECYRGNSLSYGSPAVIDGRCDMVCGGNASEICGGSGALTLYGLANLNINKATATSSVSVLSRITFKTSSIPSLSSTPSISSSTSTSSSTFSSSSTSASSTSSPILPLASCPTSNGTLHTGTSSNATFLLECDLDHPGDDFSLVYVNSYSQCIAACANTINCTDFSWVAGGPGSPCCLKDRVVLGVSKEGV